MKEVEKVHFLMFVYCPSVHGCKENKQQGNIDLALPPSSSQTVSAVPKGGKNNMALRVL